MGKTQVKAVVEAMESRMLLSVTPAPFEMGTDGRHQLASNDNGGWAFAYQSGTSLHVRSSGGAQFEVAQGSIADSPQVDATPAKFVAAWAEANGSTWAIKASIMDFPVGAAQPATTVVTVASGKGIDASVSDVAVGGNSIVVVYAYAPKGFQPGQNRFQRLSLTGGKLGRPADAPYGGSSADMSAKDDSFVLVWHASNTQTDVLAQRYSASGAKVGAQITVAGDPTVHERHSDIDMDAEGNFVVSYARVEEAPYKLDAMAQIVTASGALGPTVTVKQGSVAPTTGDSTGPEVQWPLAIDVAPDGSFVASWAELHRTRFYDNGRLISGYHDTSVLMQRFSAAGAPVGGEEFVASDRWYGELGADDVWIYSGGGVDAREIASLGNGEHLVSFSRWDGNREPTGTRFGQYVSNDNLPLSSGVFNSTAIEDGWERDEEPLPASL